MDRKITFPKSFFDLAHLLAIILLLVYSSSSFSQTVTNVFPTRVTSDTKITIIGTSLSAGDNFTIQNNSIGVDSKVTVSTTEMTINIDRNSTSNRTGNLYLNGVDTGFTINFIGYDQKELSNTSGNDVTRIDEIYTTYNGFWRSGDWKADNSDRPNDNHDLLGFKQDGIIYSTGVNDSFLVSNLLPSETDNDDPLNHEYIPQTFRAYSTNGVVGQTHSGNFLAMGDLVDGVIGEGTTITSPAIQGLTVFDVIIDGENGLDLGTGIANFNTTADIRFFSGNGQVGALDITDPSDNDDAPDLIITQIAQPGSQDLYYYADELGNVVGRPIRLLMRDQGNGPGLLAEWRLDLYRFNNNVNYDVATPVARSFSSNETRPLRIVAFKLEDFDIDATNIDDINNINMLAGGRADIAFLAYNKSAFDIKSPVIELKPVSRFVCKFPNNSDITFNARANIDGGLSSPADMMENLSYEWFKFNDEIMPAEAGSMIPGVTGADYGINGGSEVLLVDLATYKVKISNGYGTVILPVTLSEGGTPVTWNGTEFALPPNYAAAGILPADIDDFDRSLSFNTDYSEAVDVRGCDCFVPAGLDVVIPSEHTMTLYDELDVEPTIPETIIDGVINPEVPAGTFTLMDDASLVQTKPVTTNINTGSILMQRDASDLHDLDYVYWSSPVENFDILNIPGNRTFEWLTNASNPIPDSEGNWSTATGIMVTGKGYIKRVPSATTITTDFLGRPNNGVVTTTIVTTTSPSSNPSFNNWNLIGNPYPSAINAVDFLMTNPNVDGFVDIWTHHEALSSTQNPGDSPFYENYAYNYSDQYLTHNAMGTTPPPSSGVTFNGNIAAGQAFFVQANTSGNVTFNNALRHSAEIGYDNTDFFRSNINTTTKNNSEKQSIWLSLVKDNDQATTTLLGYAEGATDQKDRMFDAGTNGSDFSIYSLIEEGKMRIQGRSLPFIDNDIVPLGVKLDQNGVYEIAIDRLEGSVFVDEEQAIYLEDTYTNLTHDLRQSPYTFTGNEGELNNRFLVRYTNETLSTEENSVTNTFVFINDGLLNVKSSKQINTVDVFDLTGKRIIRHYAMGQKALKTEFIYASGVYLVSVLFNDGTALNKKVIN